MLKSVYCLLFFLFTVSPNTELPDSKLAKDVRETVWPRLIKEMKDKGLEFNNPIYIRIFKEEHLLEVWIRSGEQYRLFKRYEVCFFSGGLGTKIRSGDGKSPEGFYTIEPKQLNPVSNYYLAINIGYPNKVEVLKGYTGDAMTNPYIEEIYTLVYKAFESGQQKINLDIFPFKMDTQHMETYATNPNLSFWKTMKPGYRLFEKNHIPPVAGIKGDDYFFKN